MACAGRSTRPVRSLDDWTGERVPHHQHHRHDELPQLPNLAAGTEYKVRVSAIYQVGWPSSTRSCPPRCGSPRRRKRSHRASPRCQCPSRPSTARHHLGEEEAPPPRSETGVAAGSGADHPIPRGPSPEGPCLSFSGCPAERGSHRGASSCRSAVPTGRLKL